MRRDLFRLRFRSRLFWLPIVGILGAAQAHAQGNYEIQVYGADTIAPKTTMLVCLFGKLI